MRTKIMMLLLLPVLAALNYGLYKKEQIKAHGETLLLELTPSDPRSLMRGDYRRLRYAITRDVPTAGPARGRGYIVVRPDEDKVAQFIRFHSQEEALAEDEKLLRFHMRRRHHVINIVPNAFFLQEGHAKQYQSAKYAVFKFNDAHNHLLVGLADKDRQIIMASDPKNGTNDES